MQPVTDPDLLAILNGGEPASGGPVYGPPPKAPAAPTPLQQRDQEIQEEKERRSRLEWEATHNPDGSPKPNAASAQATEQERKAGAFLIRALGSNESYEAQDIGPRSLPGQYLADTVPNLLNTLPGVIGNSPERQVADSAQDEFIAASLRQDSGAAIPPEEMERQRRIYFPMPGDGPEAIEQKRMARLRAVEGLRQSAGRLEAGAEERYRQMVGPQPDEAQAGREAGAMVGGALGGLEGTVSDETPSPYDPGGPLNPGNNPSGGRFLGALSLPPAIQNISDQFGQGFIGVGQGLAGMVDFATMAGGAAMPPSAQDIARMAYGESPINVQFGKGTNLAGMVEQVSPTPAGMEGPRLAGQLSSMAIPIPGPRGVPRVPVARPAPTAAREVIEAGQREGVRVMTSDVRPPTTFTGKVARATGERIPYAGTGGLRAAQQAERQEAVRRLADDYGVEADAAILDDVAADLSATRGARLTTLTNAKNSVIDSIGGPVPPVALTRTLEAINTQAQRLASIDAQTFAPVIERLQRFGANIASGKTLREIEGNRKLLGDMFEDASLAAVKGDGQKALNAIYAPLREDMGAFISTAAGKGARAKWAKANDELSTMAGELNDNVFRGVLQSAETTPENVARVLFSNKPSEVRRLVASLSPEGRTRAQAAIIQRAMEKAGDNLSPDRFANEVGRLGRSIGVVFEGADLARIQGLERLLQATKQAGVASAAPPTGVQNAPLLMGAGVGATGGAAAIPLAVYGGLARLYESAPVRNMLVGLGKSAPGSKGESQLLERILKVATSQTQIRGGAANDVLAASPSRVAASEQENN